MSDTKQLRREIAALEAEIDGSVRKAQKRTPDADLMGEIRAMEAKLACDYMDDEPFGEAEQGCEAEQDAPVEAEQDDDSMLVESVSLRSGRRGSRRASAERASEADPSGVEEQITQDRFSEVEKLRGKEGLATEDSMLSAAPTGYVARLRSASARLDRVADYLEKHGKKALAFRVDKIADAIDACIKKEEGTNE